MVLSSSSRLWLQFCYLFAYKNNIVSFRFFCGFRELRDDNFIILWHPGQYMHSWSKTFKSKIQVLIDINQKMFINSTFKYTSTKFYFQKPNSWFNIYKQTKHIQLNTLRVNHRWNKWTLWSFDASQFHHLTYNWFFGPVS